MNMWKQVAFRELGVDDAELLGGLLSPDEKTIICGCCGGTFDLDDEDVEIVRIFADYWVPLSEEIIGGWAEDDEEA